MDADPVIRIYTTADGRARVLTLDHEPPPRPPLQFVAAFDDQAAEDAWELLEKLGFLTRSSGSLSEH